MNGFRTRRLAAAAAVLLGTALGACGGDDDGTVAATPVTGTSGTTGSPGSGTTGQTGNGPASSGDRYPDAPDNIIGDRPGGPNTDSGAQGGGSSGGITPPAKPSPTQ